ncbi:hypothetical protein RU89_GL000040 [Lactococcus cremoris]|nr:hypothetical protein AB995_0545 [Lactococcus cremoris]KZK42474.1 hypothetical protein LMG6897_0547 [Lactococcus cremoris]PCS20280.1 hypothetical protein RU89_GL000040 [Lactococcus cremoris]
MLLLAHTTTPQVHMSKTAFLEVAGNMVQSHGKLIKLN